MEILNTWSIPFLNLVFHTFKAICLLCSVEEQLILKLFSCFSFENFKGKTDYELIQFNYLE